MTSAPEAPPTFLDRHARDFFIIALFVVVFVAVRLTIKPINDTDYHTFSAGLDAFRRGESPYSVGGYFMPPWSTFFLYPLLGQPIETWLALDVALFAAMTIDLGSLPALLLLAHPVFITLIASSNAEWFVVGPGLWLLYRGKKGWWRGLAWLLLTCKPQTTLFLLLFDGWDALRERDWKAIGLAAGVATVTLAVSPQFFSRIQVPLDWSATVIAHYGLIVALLVALLIVAIRWRRLDDRKTLGLLLAPILSPYMLQYSYTATLFTMRRAGWIRTIIYVIAGIGLAALFWQNFHVSEQLGTLGMVLLAAILAPAYRPEAPDTANTPIPVDGAPTLQPEA